MSHPDGSNVAVMTRYLLKKNAHKHLTTFEIQLYLVQIMSTFEFFGLTKRVFCTKLHSKNS